MDFGEVVTTSSRAFWNDYEDWEANRTPNEDITFDCYGSAELNKRALEKLDTFLVIEGARLSAFFMEAVLKGMQPVCQVLGRRSWLYILEHKPIAVFLTEERDLMTFSQITEQLFPYIRVSTRVMTLNVEPSVSYKVAADDRTDDMKDSCFVRGINTKGTSPRVVELKEPNLITGVAAGVATWCKFSNLPWVSYVAYCNEPDLDALTTAPILRLLRDLDIPCSDSYNAKQKSESNLYT